MITEYDDYADWAKRAVDEMMIIYKNAVLDGLVECKSDIKPFCETLKETLSDNASTPLELSYGVSLASMFLLDAVEYYEDHK